MPNVRVGSYATVRKDTTGLDALLATAEEAYVVRVGILGSKAAAKHERKETGELKKSGGHQVGQGQSDLTNADIGLRHEKGVKSEHLPRRSWLVTPLEDKLPEYFQALGDKAIELIVLKKSLKAYEELSVICEQIIQKGFETGGYGKWKPLAKFTIEQKGSSRILIDTGQLKKSITSTVVKNVAHS